jgi:hypothetical protein
MAVLIATTPKLNVLTVSQQRLKLEHFAALGRVLCYLILEALPEHRGGFVCCLLASTHDWIWVAQRPFPFPALDVDALPAGVRLAPLSNYFDAILKSWNFDRFI